MSCKEYITIAGASVSYYHAILPMITNFLVFRYFFLGTFSVILNP